MVNFRRISAISILITMICFFVLYLKRCTNEAPKISVAKEVAVPTEDELEAHENQVALLNEFYVEN